MSKSNKMNYNIDGKCTARWFDKCRHFEVGMVGIGHVCKHFGGVGEWECNSENAKKDDLELVKEDGIVNSLDCPTSIGRLIFRWIIKVVAWIIILFVGMSISHELYSHFDPDALFLLPVVYVSAAWGYWGMGSNSKRKKRT